MKAKTRIFLRAAKGVCTNLHSLFFLNGFLLCLIIYSYIEDQYEQETFNSLHAYVMQSFNGKPVNDDSVLLRSVHLTYSLETMHRKVFSAAAVGGFIANDIRPVSFDLATGQGACGSASMVLGRLLSMHYPIRFLQMQVNGMPGGHHVLEVKLNDHWVVVDPLYDLHFTRPDGKMASFEDIQGNWSYYKTQTPSGYDMRYRYEAATHTNWNKIPLVMPAIKMALNLVVGRKREDAISLRTILLRKYHVLFIMLLVFYAMILSYTIRCLFRKKARTGKSLSYSYFGTVVQPGKQLIA